MFRVRWATLTLAASLLGSTGCAMWSSDYSGGGFFGRGHGGRNAVVSMPMGCGGCCDSGWISDSGFYGGPAYGPSMGSTCGAGCGVTSHMPPFTGGPILTPSAPPPAPPVGAAPLPLPASPSLQTAPPPRIVTPIQQAVPTPYSPAH